MLPCCAIWLMISSSWLPGWGDKQLLYSVMWRYVGLVEISWNQCWINRMEPTQWLTTTWVWCIWFTNCHSDQLSSSGGTLLLAPNHSPNGDRIWILLELPSLWLECTQCRRNYGIPQLTPLFIISPLDAHTPSLLPLVVPLMIQGCCLIMFFILSIFQIYGTLYS